MAEIGLFPLELVLLPTERVPLHIFEPRYKELIGECLRSGDEFGLVLEDEQGRREIGTRAAVVEEMQEIDEPDGGSGSLSFEIAARVDFGIEPKQELLELLSEPERLRQLCALLEGAIEAVRRQREVRERASTNGKVSHG